MWQCSWLQLSVSIRLVPPVPFRTYTDLGWDCGLILDDIEKRLADVDKGKIGSVEDGKSNRLVALQKFEDERFLLRDPSIICFVQ
jgi:hypothetical protein